MREDIDDIWTISKGLESLSRWARVRDPKIYIEAHSAPRGILVTRWLNAITRNENHWYGATRKLGVG